MIPQRRKIILAGGLLLGLLVYLICFSPTLAGLRSDWVLRAQGASFENNSVFYQTGLKLTVPTSAQTGDNRWSDTMKLFHCGENFPHNGAGQLSILYNFGAFANGRSGFYHPDSATFNAHYGVYAIHQTDGVFGYHNGMVDVDAITALVAFDQQDLVLTSLGCPAELKHFSADITSLQPGPAMAGFSDWVQLDAVIQTNAPLYREQGFRAGTLQYGRPPADYDGPDFPVVPMIGRLYLRHDPARQITVIYFVIAKNAALVEETSTAYLLPIVWSTD